MSQRKLIILLCSLITIGQFATVIYLPSMPAISKELAATPQLTELTLTLYMLTFGLSQLIYGPLSDRYGRKVLIIAGFIIYIIGSLASAFAFNIYFFLTARLIEGFGAGGITALTRATVNDEFQGDSLTKALSLSAITASLASMISPVLGGFIQQHLNWRVNFWFLASYATFFLIIVAYSFPRRKISPSAHSMLKDVSLKYFELIRNRRFIVLALTTGISFAGITSYYVASPFIFQHQLHLSPSQYGLLFLATSGGFITGGLMTSYLHLSSRFRLWLGIGLMIISNLTLLLLGYLGYFNVFVIIVPITVLMFGISFVYTTAMTCAVSPFKHIAGSAAAMVGCIQILSAGIGTAIIANLPQFNQIPLAWFLLILSLIVFFMIFFMRPKLG